ncbi:MAG: HAMP domain-containing histidine kinase, partial [Anaerolineae bacterium]|nr:HAMP domain-containing histidine kinase [Anaerolineae bacterium]
ALELLTRLRSAAPPATADRLDQIVALIQSLSEEVAFFNARVLDDTDLLAREPSESVPAAPPPEPQRAPLSDQSLAGDSSVLDVLLGMDEALRAPLVGIRGRAELLQTGLLGQITPEQAQWLHAIHDNTDRAFRLLDAVQYLMTMQRDEVQVDWSDFIASDLLEEARKRVLERAEGRGHDLAIVVTEPVPMARGDFYQSLIVLTDLLDNAIRYTEKGGKIRLSVDNLGTHVLFNVADNGIGLRPEDMDQVGSPFWRGDYHPLVRLHGGTGLSLFLARQVLALQGGELIFSGESGVGSTFSFTLLAPD